MNLSGRCLLRLSLLSAFTVLSSSAARADQQWTQPTPEELSMTSQKEVPGAAAVYLYREETTDDKLHMFSIYTRLKVLTELGKEYGNVELTFDRSSDGSGFTVDNIQGRTIHPDGIIIPFTGKPYEKLIEKGRGVKVMAKVFSLPNVEIGSIIEYRYKLRMDDRWFSSPQWYIQSNLWTRKAHYSWRPFDFGSTSTVLTDSRGNVHDHVAWASVLPAGTQVKQTNVPGGTQSIMDLDVHDIPPAPDEDFMPPIHGYTLRVLFYYTGSNSPDDFWKNEGKFWAKTQDKFIGPGAGVNAAVKDIIAPSDTPDQKLRKLYAAVMKLENTRYTREHSTQEEKAQGFKEVKNTDDIWTRKRGSDDQLAELFIAMARAAGFKAYAAIVTNRDRNMFAKNYLTLSQLNDVIAIVNVNGKDQLFDPGTRFCPYGHLAWKHTLAQGIRQTDSGSDIFNTNGDGYNYSRTQRVANLTVNDHGELTGTINLTFTGDPALHWRQRYLQGDNASLERDLRTSLEEVIPAGIELKVTSFDKLEDYEQPLVANIEVKGTLGSATGKRVLLPGDIFEANSHPSFPHEKREIPVCFHYPQLVQDAIRIHFPKTFSVESLPASEKTTYEQAIGYVLTTESTPDSFTIRRNYALGDIIFPVDKYPAFRAFYSKIESRDHESVVLTTAPVAAKTAASTN